MEKIFVIGLGYIGLPTAAMFSKAGYEVIGYDANPEVGKKLEAGEDLVEAGVQDLVNRGLESGKLRIVSDYEKADVFIICVPTPINEDKTPNMAMVRAAAEAVAGVLERGNTVVLESTSPPGTCNKLIAPIIEEKTGFKAEEDYFLAHSPERVIPGNIVYELVHNERIVGGYGEKSAQKVKGLYQSFVQAEILTTDTTTAEAAKLMENTYRDVNIAFANEALRVAKDLGINVWEMIHLANRHPRVNILTPGPGVGGHCIAVDPWFIANLSPSAQMISMARRTNDTMPTYTGQAIEGILDKGKLAILGLAFKANTDDFRGSPILDLVAYLDQAGYDLALTDPYGEGKTLGGRDLLPLEEALEGADLLVLAVDHKAYKDLDFKALGDKMAQKKVFDTRNVLNREDLEALGFDYYLLGDGRHA
ncbi:MAG: nucleotide sugar dehydrogenase [Tissierellia bacterium]|nr:nucleotide sugar dehydrogenase [Tissierellia bacterium]